MIEDLRKTPKLKLFLAAMGILTLLVAAGGTVVAIVSRETPQVSDLALHPERQDEILARREADGYRDQLGLSEEQTVKIAEILLDARKRAIASKAETVAGPQQMMVRMRDRGQATEAIRAILTPEQQAAFDKSPAGKRREMMQIMRDATPEDREAFRKQMQERIQADGGRGFPAGGGPGFPPGFGPPTDRP